MQLFDKSELLIAVEKALGQRHDSQADELYIPVASAQKENEKPQSNAIIYLVVICLIVMMLSAFLINLMGN